MEGVECPVLQTDGEELYALVGETNFDQYMGQRVEVQGTPQGMSFCMQGIPLLVENIWVLD